MRDLSSALDVASAGLHPFTLAACCCYSYHCGVFILCTFWVWYAKCNSLLPRLLVRFMVLTSFLNCVHCHVGIQIIITSLTLSCLSWPKGWQLWTNLLNSSNLISLHFGRSSHIWLLEWRGALPLCKPYCLLCMMTVFTGNGIPNWVFSTSPQLFALFSSSSLLAVLDTLLS